MSKTQTKEFKKILFIATDFPPQKGGVATYSWEIANNFHKRGFEVTVVTRKQARQQKTDFDIIAIDLPPTGLLSFPVLAFKLFFLLRKNSYHHIFCSLWLPDALAVYLANRWLNKKIPYSISVHAMEIIESTTNYKKKARKLIQPLKRKCFLAAHSCFCVSTFTKKLLLSTVTLDESKVHVVHNGVNPENFWPAKETKSTEAIRILTACRLIPNKGIDQVLQILPQLISKHPNLHYTIVGDGPDKQRLQNLVQQNDLSPHVHFTGSIEHNKLVEHYQKAHLFIMLSRQQEHYVEGFGLVFLEASLCKTPSLGGLSGGVPEAIEENLTGWLVSPTDTRAIYEKLDSLLSQPDVLVKTGEQARIRTLNAKTWDHSVESILPHIGGTR